MFLSDSLVLEVNNATSRCYRIDYKLAKCWIQWITQTEFTEWTRKKTNAIFFSRWIVSLWKYEKITKVVLRIYREIYSTGGIIHVYCPYLANNLIQLFSVCHRAYECLLLFCFFSSAVIVCARQAARSTAVRFHVSFCCMSKIQNNGAIAS